MNAPLISVCIPTHDGRREYVRAAIESVLGQLTDQTAPLVELCVSDNASADGTSEMAAEYADRLGGAFTYSRNVSDLGSAANILAAASLARGEYCWLLGSDDAMAPDAIDRAISLISAYPDASGFTVGVALFDGELEAEIEPLPSGTLPNPVDRVEVFETTDGIVRECGTLMCSISANIVRSTLWSAEVGGREADIVRRFKLFPPAHVYLRIASRYPRWVWYPRKLVIERFVSREGMFRNRWFRSALAFVREVGSDLASVDRTTRACWNQRLAELLATPAFLQAYKAEGSNLVDDWDLLWGNLRTFGVGTILRLLPTLLTPHVLIKAAIRRARERSRRRDDFGCVAEVSASVPRALPCRHTLRAECSVKNLGRQPFSSLVRPRRPRFFLGYRWYDPDGNVVAQGRCPMTRTIRSGRARTVSVEYATPWESGSYRFRISLVREDGLWPEDSPPQSWSADVIVSAAPPSLPPAYEPRAIDVPR